MWVPIEHCERFDPAYVERGQTYYRRAFAKAVIALRLL
jgi:hypothetical protein